MTPSAEPASTIRVSVNGSVVRCTVEPRMTLADLLRDQLRLTGTKLGCEHGVCGACTVHVNGLSVRSCLMLAVQADGAEVRTVEDLARGRELNDLQAAFRDHHALQCGFCTAGFLMTASELLEGDEPLTEQTIRIALSGSICRCTGYETIVDAVMCVAEARGRAAW